MEGGFLLWGFTLKMKGIREGRRIREMAAQQSTTLLKKRKRKRRNIFGLIFTIFFSSRNLLSSSLIRSFEFLNFSGQTEFQV